MILYSHHLCDDMNSTHCFMEDINTRRLKSRVKFLYETWSP